MTAIRSDDRLKGKTAIVTGAGSRAEGIGNGRATAVILARHGARVTLVDTTAQWAEETKRLIDAEGGTAQIIEVDIEAWDSAIRRNVASVMLMAKFAIPEMIRSGGGSIINLSSVAGLLGGHPSLLYPTSKGAIVSLTRAMAAHHGRDGIRVNCIAPGTVYTPMVASRGMTPEMRKARSERTLLGTEGTGWDIGYGALFLASDESRWITGITLSIDGGATAGSKGSPVPPSEPAKA